MERFYTWTIGCQMNKADSERLEGALGQLGLSPTSSPNDADVIVLNSCVVRQSAEDKVVGMLTSLKPMKYRATDKVIALMGCMVGPKTEELRRRFPYVDVFMRPQQYQPLLDMLGARMGIDVEGCLASLVPSRPSVSTFVPIIHGCDLMCSFCIIPYRRGRQVSRPFSEIVREVELLVNRGVKEVTLLGQTVDAYGQDLPDKPDLADLLYALHDISGLLRIRFLTSHPIFMSDRIIGAISELDRVCEHINLPFQAGDDEMLLRMRRRYGQVDYLRLVEKIRKAIPNVSLSTDVILGFSGETEEQFERTVAMLREVRFDKVHAAAYSPREGTIAWRKMEDDVPVEDKKRRLQIVEQLQEQIAGEINVHLLGQRVEVLVDGYKGGKTQGRSRNDKLVFFEDGQHRLGDIVNIKIDKTSPWSLQGTIVP